MERIGYAASRMTKGNLLYYNLVVVVLTILFSLMVFCIAGTSIVLSMIVIGYIANGVLPGEASMDWRGVVKICMVALSVIVSIFALLAILRNFKWRSNPDERP